MCCWPALSHAHLITTGLGPVYDSVTHFALTPEVLLPVIALAALSGLKGNVHARRATLVLPIAWLLAGMAGVSGCRAVPDSLAWLPLLVMGGLVAADPKFTPRATTAIAAVLGVVLGYATGCAMTQSGAGAWGVVSIAFAVFVVASLASAAAASWQGGWMRIAWRVVGSWIAAGGLLLLGWSLR